MNGQALIMKPIDNVAVALVPLKKESIVALGLHGEIVSIELKDDIEFGHKFAVKRIQQGQDVKKYGEVIGVASNDIDIGEHVHIHNVEGKRGRGDKFGRKQATHGL
ncbi:UxaA family hydrolase [Pseudalkalibacillus salsuginis]|uniref:UxaA family hydrolase n=1 Tax=Pseudalkalibacillus salsuginis TaxID=2910972 RepID=UPI001F42963E|nr:UxaA family hydrolase [Pseudalkalibacillus salsuginis]MCF6411330.1 UxaA family hydrolase [Pseudalkalibacillus salsuginis]